MGILPGGLGTFVPSIDSFAGAAEIAIQDVTASLVHPQWPWQTS
jgi:hypothetical protein